MSYTYEYPRPAVTADIMLFRRNGNSTSVLLVRRKNPPFKDKWALPGGFMDMDETLETTARRELKEETGIAADHLIPFHVYDQPGRDPRGRTITLVFYTILDKPPSDAAAGDDAADLSWFDLQHLPELGFDHSKIISQAAVELGL